MQNTRRGTWLGTLVGLVVAAVLLPMGTANAEFTSGTDPRYDAAVPGSGGYGGVGDIVRYSANHTDRRVWVTANFRIGSYDETSAYLDTRPRRPGYEFTVLRTYWGVSLWGPRGHRVQCHALGQRLRQGEDRRDSRKRITLFVGRQCIDHHGHKPGKVRVRVEEADETYTLVRDWAPSKRGFTPWLRNG